MKAITVLIMATLSSLWVISCSPEPDPDTPATQDQPFHFTETSGEFDATLSFLKTAIEEEGLKITTTGNIAEMLVRTKEAVGRQELIYKHAIFYQFCSAKHAFKLFAANPNSLATCPFTIFSYELKAKPGQIFIGYRAYPKVTDAKLKAAYAGVDQLMKRIIERAVE